MTEQEYRKNPAVSRSDLWRIRESPQKFKYYKDNPQAPSPSLVFGQLFHKMLLEPGTVWDDFAVAPDANRRTKEGKEIWRKFSELNEGKTIITPDMLERSSAMCESVHNEILAKKLLLGEREKPFFWIDEITGEACKCRVDCLNMNYEQPIIIDVKTTSDASTEAFIRSSINYGYDLQAAMYSEGVEKNIEEKPLFVFIAVEKEPPYAVNILQADELLLVRGFDIFRECIGIYHDCKSTGDWYGYLGKYGHVNNLALPAYLAKEVK